MFTGWHQNEYRFFYHRFLSSREVKNSAGTFLDSTVWLASQHQSTILIIIIIRVRYRCVRRWSRQMSQLYDLYAEHTEWCNTENITGTLLSSTCDFYTEISRKYERNISAKFRIKSWLCDVKCVSTYNFHLINWIIIKFNVIMRHFIYGQKNPWI